MQRVARSIYVTAMRAAFLAKSRNFRQYVDTYHSMRSMDFYHDVHDWMGGYPYESISPDEFLALAGQHDPYKSTVLLPQSETISPRAGEPANIGLSNASRSLSIARYCTILHEYVHACHDPLAVYPHPAD